jgi:hypothetical protein
MNLKEDSNFNYIFTEKPLIFKNLKLKKITDLIEKNNKDSNQLNKKKEINDEDLDVCSEEYLTKYFAQYNIVLDINKDPNLKEKFEEQPNINNETENDFSMSSRKDEISYRSIQKEILFPLNKNGNKKDDCDELLDDVLSDEELNSNENRVKKNKIKFNTYISSIFLTNCEIESIEGIDKTFNNILANFSINNEIKDKIENKLLLIQWLDLSNNKLSFIHKDLISLVNLKILNLNNNLFNDLNKVTNLGEMKNLINLTFIGNKIIKVPGYRQFLIEMCPILQQLDSAQVTEKELEVVHFGGSKFGEIRENGNGKVIRYPKLFK